MRIISGTCRGKKLQPFPGKKIRPTSDRLREAIFNILADRIREALVLDLFAGTGALGLEALSRGARAATFIENDPLAVSLLKKNIQACRLELKARVIQWDILKNLRCVENAAPAYTLVFMDPPYRRNMIPAALQHLHAGRCLQNAARIVIEHSKFEADPPVAPPYHFSDRREYGKTLVSFLEYMI